jgi:hypothetical protein
MLVNVAPRIALYKPSPLYLVDVLDGAQREYERCQVVDGLGGNHRFNKKCAPGGGDEFSILSWRFSRSLVLLELEIPSPYASNRDLHA